MNQLEMIAWALMVHTQNRNADEGDKILSSAEYFVEAVDTIVNDNSVKAIARLIREGWLPGQAMSAPPQGDPS